MSGSVLFGLDEEVGGTPRLQVVACALPGVVRPIAEENAESFRVPYTGIQVASGQQDQKFLAAIPSHCVVRPQRRRDALCELSQYGVSSHVPKGVVQILEVVDIDHHDGDLS